MLKIMPPMVALAMTTACSDGCANQIVRRAAAPDGRLTAVLFQRDCGATTGFSTQISILAEREALSGSGNAYRADDDHGAAAAGSWGGPWADMKWMGPDWLLVRFAAGSRFFKQESEVAGVRIAYQSVRQ